MKYLVISDIHGIKKYALEIPRIIDIEKPDKIIILGDLYYHGNDKKMNLESIDVTNILNEYSKKIICTRGNCDTDIDIAISEFEIKEYIKIIINNKKFFFTHGHKYNDDNIFKDIDIFVFGHLHTGFIKKYNEIIYVNSGSISLPRNNTHNSYLVIDDEYINLKDINGNLIDKYNYI